jgi:hypothetical protein
MVWIRRIAIGFVSLVLLVALAAAGSYYLGIVRPFQTTLASHRRAIEDNKALFIADQGAIKTSGLFDINANGKDAGTFLNHQIVWEPAQAKQTLEFPKDIQELISNADQLWLEALATADLSSVDTQWILKLSEFSYWDLRTDTLLSDHNVSNENFLACHYHVLVVLVKLYFV